MWSLVLVDRDSSVRHIACLSHQHARDVYQEMFIYDELDSCVDHWVEDPDGELVGYKASEF